MSSDKPEGGAGGIETGSAAGATEALRTEEVRKFACGATGRSWQPPSLEQMQEMLPQYRFVDALGAGGMGAVYKARQVSLDRLVAVKVLPPEARDRDDTSFVERFKQEARTLAKLDHPGIVHVHDFGETNDGQFYFVMDFVDGTDVQKLIRDHKRIPPEQAVAITAHVCDALAHAHAQGVIHRDIKPANVLINTAGRVKLADFGLAKMADAQPSGGLTRSNVVVGTPHYMAPEAMQGDARLDARADLYSLGVMLYHMLTGEIPGGVFKMPSQKAGCDPRFDRMVGRAMEADRESRYQSAAEIRADLDAICATPAAGNTHASAPGPSSSPARGGGPRRAPDLAEPTGEEPHASRQPEAGARVPAADNEAAARQPATPSGVGPPPGRPRSVRLFAAAAVVACAAALYFLTRPAGPDAAVGGPDMAPATFNPGPARSGKSQGNAATPVSIQLPPAESWTDAMADLRRDGVADGLFEDLGQGLLAKKSAAFYLADGRKFRDAAVRVAFAGPPSLALMLRVNSVNRYTAGIAGADSFIALVHSAARGGNKPLVKRPLAPAFDPAAEHELVFAVQDHALALWLDGREAGTVRDDALVSGPIGLLLTSDGPGARIRKVEYVNLAGATP